MNKGQYARLRKADAVQRRVRRTRKPPAVDGWDKVLDVSERSPALRLRPVTAQHRIDGFGRDLSERQIQMLKQAAQAIVEEAGGY